MITAKKGDAGTTTRAVIYARFSPRPDAATSESLEVQQGYCEQFAHKKGWVVDGLFLDPDVSGADEYRPRLWSAIDSLKKGDVLLVYKRDRLARNVYLSETINRAVRKKGGMICAVSGDVEGEGPEQTMIRQVVAAMAEYERKIISRRTSDSLRSYLRQNRMVSSRPPYGYKKDPDDPTKFVIDDTEMPILRRIAELHEKGESNNAIAHMLDPASSRSGRWHTGSVRCIVKRLEYMPLPD